MGLSFSLGKLKSGGPPLNATRYSYSLLQYALSLMHMPRTTKGVLFGVDEGVNTNNVIGLLSLLDIAWNEDWVFQTLDNMSVAYFELVLITLNWLNRQRFGQAGGRVSLYIMALASNAVEAAGKLEKRGASKAMEKMKAARTDTKTAVRKLMGNGNSNYEAMEIPTLANIEKMSEFQAIEELKTHYNIIKSRFVRSAGLKCDLGSNRNLSHLKLIIRELRELRQDAERASKEFYDQRGRVFNIGLKTNLHQVQFGSQLWSTNLAIALVDLIHPFQAPEGAPRVNQGLDRTLDDIPDQPFCVSHATDIDLEEMGTAAQDNVAPFVLNMLEPTESGNKEIGQSILAYLQGSKFAKDREIAIESFQQAVTNPQHPVNREEELMQIWDSLQPVCQHRSVTQQRLMVLECALNQQR